LHFNLKEANNAYKALCGEIEPSRLVDMTAEEFSGEELRQFKRRVSEEKMRDTVLTEAMAAKLLKQTKGATISFHPY
jgi:hypothetical protein